MTGTDVADKEGRPAGRKHDPERVRDNILDVALTEFATKGLSGARVEEIADKTDTSKRMIYYYFQSKEGLYSRVIERAYEEVRRGEQSLNLEQLEPIDALRRLVQFTFDHHASHPQFIRLVMIENIHNAKYLKDSTDIKSLNISAVERLESLFRRGVDEGVFRDGISAIELHWFISALCFFNVSNKATFSHLYGAALFQGAGQKALREHAADTVLRAVLTRDALASYVNETEGA